jgi:hypothetical protein
VIGNPAVGPGEDDDADGAGAWVGVDVEADADGDADADVDGPEDVEDDGDEGVAGGQTAVNANVPPPVPSEICRAPPASRHPAGVFTRTPSSVSAPLTPSVSGSVLVGAAGSTWTTPAALMPNTRGRGVSPMISRKATVYASAVAPDTG